MSKQQFEQRYVAFVDILGFRDLVSRMSGDEHLFESVRDALKDVATQSRNFREYRRELNKKKSALSSVVKTNLQMTAFSDCYVLSETSPAWHVVAAVQALGSRFLRDGILTRGGVVVGRAYHNSGVLFGPGVIDAYKLETSAAFYPRILVTEEVRQAVWGYHRGLWKSRLLKRDSDGWWFVNLLVPSSSSWRPLSDPTAPEDARAHLKQVRRSLVGALKRAEGEPEHFAKVWWLVRKFNKAAAKEDVNEIGNDTEAAGGKS